MNASTVPDPDRVTETASLMRLLGDPTRIRLLRLLLPGERHVSALCGELDLAQPTVSHHLALLRKKGLIVARREGKQIFYSLNREHVAPLGSEGGLQLTFGRVKMYLGCPESSARSAATATLYG